MSSSTRKRKEFKTQYSYISRCKIPKLPSFSSLSRSYGVRESNYFALCMKSKRYTYADELSEHNKYNLDQLRFAVGLPAVPRDNKGKPKISSDESAKEFLQRHLSGIHDLSGICDDWHYTVDTCIPKVNELPTLISNTLERPDVTLYTDNECTNVITTFEVLSSPMEYTIYKSILGAANVIRLLRCQDIQFNSFTCFTLPSTTSASLIVQVYVVWRNLQFSVTLTYFDNLEDGLKAIENCYIQVLAKRNPNIPIDIQFSLIEIDKSEVSQYLKLPYDRTSLSSVRHIMLQSTKDGKDIIYKVLYEPLEVTLFYETFHLPSSTRFIQRYMYMAARYVVYNYNKVTYKPLNFEEAHGCLMNLLLSIREAIEELHSYHVRHNDIRLPNICFNSQFEAVLIDLDACSRTEYVHPYFSSSRSCMYKVDHLPLDGNTDYMQLGWLIVNVLDPDEDEHDRHYVELPEYIRHDQFISLLILEGRWDEKSFLSFKLGGSETLENIIRKANPNM